MDVPTNVRPEFSRRLTQRMEEKRFNVKNLAAAANTTYEHIRKVLNGGSFPSQWLLVELCHILELDVYEMQKLLAMDRVKLKFGKTIPIFDVIAEHWNDLTKTQQEDIENMVESYAKENVKAQVTANLPDYRMTA